MIFLPFASLLSCRGEVFARPGCSGSSISSVVTEMNVRLTGLRGFVFKREALRSIFTLGLVPDTDRLTRTSFSLLPPVSLSWQVGMCISIQKYQYFQSRHVFF